MKFLRPFALFLVISLSLSVSSFAEDDRSGNAILFRDLPWLIDVETFSNALESELRDPSTKQLQEIIEGSGRTPLSFTYYIDSECNTSTLDFGDAKCIFLFSLIGGMDDVLVGEYPIRSIDGFALCGIEDNEISSDPLQSHVVCAKYGFNETQIDNCLDAFNQLRVKLNFLYGEQSSESNNASYDHRISWIGDENTYVVLKYSYSLDTLELTYGRTDIPQMAEELLMVASGIGGL